VNYGPEHAALAESLNPESIEVLEMNLEDAFIAYTREAATPLPTLDREVVAC
jgi:hypothetical protein